MTRPPIAHVGIFEGFWLGIRRRFWPLSPDELPTVSLRSLRRLSDEDLLIFAAGWMPGSERRLLADAEIKRREGRTARLALTISFGALITSIAGVLLHSR